MTSLTKAQAELKNGDSNGIWQTMVQKIGNERLAYVLMLMGSTFFTGGFIFANQNKFHPYETGLVRGIACVAICYILARYTSTNIEFKSTHNIRWLLIRNSIMVIQGLVYAAVQFYLPLPIAATINNCSPLFVYIYDYFINGIKINCKQLIGVSISFLGVLLVANGPYLIALILPDFELQQSTGFANYKTKDPIQMVKAGLIMLAAIAAHGFAVVVTKKLVKVDALQINFHLGLMILISSAILFPWGVTNSSVSPQTYMLSLFLAGLPMTIGQLAYIGSLILTRNFGVITTLSFASIIFGYFVSVIRYGESINPICCVGAIGIILGITTIVIFKQKSPSDSIEK